MSRPDVDSLRRAALRNRLIVALDVDADREALRLVGLLRGEVGMFKVGKQLFLRAGPRIVREIRARGGEVFLDLKFHDIPRTVARAAMEATRMGVRMFDMHASGSFEMMRQTVEAVSRVCRVEGLRRPRVLAVTVLTSLGREDLKRVGVMSGVESQVLRLAQLSKAAGVDGVVASPLEVARIRRECGRAFVIVTPGVRLPGVSPDDQKRVLGPGDAIAAGADYLVVGRPVRDASDPRQAVRGIVTDMERGFSRLALRRRAP